MRRATTLSPFARSFAYQSRTPRKCFAIQWLQARNLSYSPALSQLQAESPSNEVEAAVPLRKHLKDERKRKRVDKSSPQSKSNDKYELTVGLEIHAELNTPTKLFSPVRTDDPPTHDYTESSHGSTPTTPANAKVAPFDAALPGTQPQFQPSTLLPALRAALALNCTINPKSTWDRKHYFHWDQPNGYQLTQFYSPFAVNGSLVLTAEDGIPASDLNGERQLVIGIKQVQMEQDTAKTIHHPPNTYHVDLNRAGHPLIEIITLPQIHSAKAAAAVVRKIVGVLKCVDACVVGMEAGGLRADVNVSVKERGAVGGEGLAYGGVKGLGQRTEIKNLASFKAVEDAIGAEMQRQIGVLEAGGVVEGETRGWTLGATETTRLRGKEGEVDYRYMPDPDLPPLVIGKDLVEFLKESLPELPEETVERLQKEYGMSSKDARSLLVLDDGDRLEFMEETVELTLEKLKDQSISSTTAGKMVGNWVLHELGGLLTTTETSWSQVLITPNDLSDTISNIFRKEITARVAKQLLASLHDIPEHETRPSVDELIDQGNLRLRPLSEEEYLAMATKLIEENPDMVAAIKEKGQKGKVMWFVGQILRQAEEGTVEPEKAREIFERLLRA